MHAAIALQQCTQQTVLRSFPTTVPCLAYLLKHSCYWGSHRQFYGTGEAEGLTGLEKLCDLLYADKLKNLRPATQDRHLLFAVLIMLFKLAEYLLQDHQTCFDSHGCIWPCRASQKAGKLSIQAKFLARLKKLTRRCSVVTVASLWGAGWSAVGICPIHDNAWYFGRRGGWLRRSPCLNAVASLWGARWSTLHIRPVHNITRLFVIDAKRLHHVDCSRGNAKATCCRGGGSQYPGHQYHSSY